MFLNALYRYRRDETGGGIEYEKEDEFEKQDTVEFENNLDKQLAAILEASPATNGINDSTETRPTVRLLIHVSYIFNSSRINVKSKTLQRTPKLKKFCCRIQLMSPITNSLLIISTT